MDVFRILRTQKTLKMKLDYPEKEVNKSSCTSWEFAGGKTIPKSDSFAIANYLGIASFIQNNYLTKNLIL